MRVEGETVIWEPADEVRPRPEYVSIPYRDLDGNLSLSGCRNCGFITSKPLLSCPECGDMGICEPVYVRED